MALSGFHFGITSPEEAFKYIEARSAVVGQWYFQSNTNMNLERKPGFQK
jgi:hypothetical protein